MGHAQVLGHFRPDLVLEQSSAQSACSAVLIVVAGLAAGLRVLVAFAASVAVLAVSVLAVYVRMRLTRPQICGLVVRPPVLMCMRAVFVAVVLYQWLAVVQWLACFVSFLERWIFVKTFRMIFWSRLLVIVGSVLPVLPSVVPVMPSVVVS